jgi:hypothetical protein
LCPADVSHDVLATQKQTVFGTVGHVPVARAGGNTAPNSLRVFTTNGLHVPFDMNVDVEIVTAVQEDSDIYGYFRYRRDIETVWSQPVQYQSVSVCGDVCALHC